jgi:tetratricopeptide (TPR) repeat protein
MIFRRRFIIALQVAALLLPQKLAADPIDSLARLAQQPAHDTITGMRYLDLAKAWFWENPANTDSLLRVAESYLGPQQYYRGLSDVHNFRANYHYMGGRPLAACSSLDTAMQFAALDGDSLHMIGIRKNLTILRSEAGDIDGALEAIEESMQYLEAHQDSSLLAQHFVQRGLLYQQKGYRRLALNDFQTAREVHLALQETERVAEAEQHIGKTLFDESNYKEALPYFLAAAKHYQLAGQQQYYAEVLTLLGTNYHRLQKYGLADSTFAASMALSKQLQQPYNIAHAQLLRAESWLERGHQLGQAASDASAAQPVFEEVLPIMAGSCQMLLARIDSAQQRWLPALDKADRSIAIFEDHKGASYLRGALRFKAAVLSKLGRPEQALAAYEQAQALSDSLFSIQQAQAIAELHLEYDTELKEREIALKAAQIDRLASEKQNAMLKNRLLGLGLLAALLLLGGGYYTYRLRQKALKAEVRHRERELAAQRLHLLQKNNLLQQVEDQLSNPAGTSGEPGHQKLLNSLRTQDSLDKDWDTFTSYFKAVHADFSEQLDRQFPTLSLTEKRLAYLFRLGTNTAEAAALLHIQPESVRKGKYRLKKKIAAVAGDDSQSLEEILRHIG